MRSPTDHPNKMNNACMNGTHKYKLSYEVYCKHISNILLLNYLYYLYLLYTTGNFGVVYQAWYSQENSHTKVAIKTLKGDLLEVLLSTFYTHT